MADESMQRASKGMKRRGILAAAGAVVAGILAKQMSQPVAAATYNLQGDTGLNSANTAHTRTLIIASGTFPANTPVLDVELTGGDFTIGSDLPVGVKGASGGTRACGASLARRISRACTAHQLPRTRASACWERQMPQG
jgi:hypothetical protein